MYKGNKDFLKISDVFAHIDGDIVDRIKILAAQKHFFTRINIVANQNSVVATRINVVITKNFKFQAV